VRAVVEVSDSIRPDETSKLTDRIDESESRGRRSFTKDHAQAFVHLGFPSYFRIELAVFKLAGVAVLLLPLWPRCLKEWAYAGFFITLISAFIAHISSGDGPSRFMSPVVFGVVLICSYLTSKKMNSVESP
jgi:uncharacterized membrane protein YphA (DoxX/SURF4 family)